MALFSGFTGSQKPEQWLCLAGLGGSKLPSFAVSEADLTKINKLADEISTIAVGLDDIPKTVQDEIAQLGTSIQEDKLEAAGTYQGIIEGYVKYGATETAGEEAANKKYPDMLNTLNTNLPTLNKVNDQLTDCKEKITIINQKLSEINELLKDK